MILLIDIACLAALAFVIAACRERKVIAPEEIILPTPGPTVLAIQRDRWLRRAQAEKAAHGETSDYLHMTAIAGRYEEAAR
jgi:hypothetical protein